MKANHFFTVKYLIYFLFLSVLTSCDKYKKELNESASNFSKRQSDKFKKVDLTNSLFTKFWDSLGLNKTNFTNSAVKMTDSVKNVTLAMAYIANFRTTSTPTTIPNGQGTPITVPPTECVWIDKDVIKSFAKEMLDDPEIDGIRIYFAKYLNFSSAIDLQMDPRFDGRETLVLVATTPIKGEKYTYHKDRYVMPGNGSASSLYIYDYNSLCPPMDTCTGATLGGH